VARKGSETGQKPETKQEYWGGMRYAQEEMHSQEKEDHMGEEGDK